MERSDIPLAARVELAHAEIQAVARARGVDALLVKGYAADPRLYVRGRVSSDVDVLTRPSHADLLVQALHEYDWNTVSTFRSGSIFQHAQTMRHPHWGLVDIHRSFPGFEMDPEKLFDQLWAQRRTRLVAGYPCDVPRTLEHALIILVHAARSPESMTQDVGHLAEVLTEADWRRLEQRAAELEATVAFAAATGQLPNYRDRPTHDLWLVLSHEGTRSQEWRARMKAATTVGGKLAVALRAPLPNVDHLRMDLGREPTALEITRATVSRPVRAVTELLTGRARRRPDTADRLTAGASPGAAPLPGGVHAAEHPHEVAPAHPGTVLPSPAPGPDAASSMPLPPAPGTPSTAPADTTAPDQPAAPDPRVPGSPPAAPGQPDSWLLGPEPIASPARRAPARAGVLRPAPGTAVVEVAPSETVLGSVCLALVPGGRPVVLNDSAALIWHLAQSTPEDSLPQVLAEATGAPLTEIGPQVRDFVSDLVTQGFLSRQGQCRSGEQP